jgi:hypothetical protein
MYYKFGEWLTNLLLLFVFYFYYFYFEIDLMEMNFLPGLSADRKPVNGGTGYVPPQSPSGGQAFPNETKEQSTMTIIKTALFIFSDSRKNNN